MTEVQTQAVPATTTATLPPSEVFRRMLDARAGEFAKALPNHISFEKFQRTVMTAVLVDKGLLEADRESLLLSCLRAAQDGLIPDKRDAALVIFNTKVKGKNGQKDEWKKLVQYMPMFTGILKKVRQTKELAGISVQVVYDRDEFNYILGDEETIIHKPYFGKEERGEVRAAYARATLKDGTIMREVMSRADLEKVRRASKAGYNDDGTAKPGPWRDWFEEMARKTVFRRLSKWLPQSVEIDMAFSNDRTMDMVDAAGTVSDAIDGTSETVVEEEPLQIENNPDPVIDQQGFTTQRSEAMEAVAAKGGKNKKAEEKAAPKAEEMIDVVAKTTGEIYPMSKKEWDEMFPADRPELAPQK